MKKRTSSLKLNIAILLLIYVIVLASGISLALVVSYNNNKSLINIAQDDLKYYSGNNEFNPTTVLQNSSNILYDSDGTILDYAYGTDSAYIIDPDYYAEKLLAKVQENQIVYQMMPTKSLLHPVSIVIAIETEDHGMFLFLRTPVSLNNMILILLYSATLLLILSAIYTAFIVRKNREFARMQREYVDNISHELKSPITSVRALTETMYDGLVLDEKKRKQYCGIMLNELHSLEHTVSYMLELSRIQNKSIDCQKTIVSAVDLFQDILNKYQILCEEMDVSFSCSPAIELCPLLCTNRNLAGRLMDILLDNAVKYCGSEGSVRIIYSNHLRYVIFTIANSGDAISPKDQPNIFARFYQGDKSHKEKGSGLGLSIAQEISSCLGEKLWLQKSDSSGTEFCFTLKKD